MRRRPHKILLTLLLAATICPVRGQERVELQRDVSVTQEIKKPGPPVTRAEGAPVSVRLERGGKVAVDNRTTGRIMVTGWDKEFVEARAVSERGAEAVLYSVDSAAPDQRVWLKADYAQREEQPQPQPTPVAAPVQPSPEPTPTVPAQTKAGEAPPQQGGLKLITKPGGWIFEESSGDSRPSEVHLEVRVPRYAEIEVIKVIRSPVEVTGVDSPVIVLGSRGEVRLKDVGAAEVRTRDGLVEIDGSAGLVDVVTSTGPIRVRNAKGDVRALSISGEVDVECARGRVNVDSTSGPVRLSNVFGDVDANSSNSDIYFSGAIREDGRYHLKSMSGAVEMALRAGPPGFTAALSSYRGTIENDFTLKMKPTSPQEGEINRRVLGSYGSGQAQITLDTFDGRVKLGKAGQMKDCK